VQWHDRYLTELSWAIVIGAMSVGLAAAVHGGPRAGLTLWFVGAGLRLVRHAPRALASRSESTGLALAVAPVATTGAFLAIADRYGRAFRLDIDPNYYHLVVVNTYVSGTSFGDSIYPRVDLPFRPDGYPLTGHALAAELVVATGGIGGILLLTVASVGLLIVAGAALAHRVFHPPAVTRLDVLRTWVMCCLLGSLFVAMPSVIDAATGVPIDALACAALAALVAVACQPRLQPTLIGGLAGTSVGVKTTTVVPVLIVLGAVVMLRRPEIRKVGVALGAAALYLAGGHWFVRDLLRHGSPAWPQLAAPWGTPSPGWFDDFSTFLAHPLYTLHAADHRQLIGFGLGAPVTLAALVVGVAVVRPRTRTLILGSLGLALLAWAAAKQTGIAPGSAASKIGFGAASRYFAPVQIVAAAATCELARRGSTKALAIGAVGGLLNLLSLGYFATDRLWALTVAGALAVVCAGVVAGSRASPRAIRGVRVLAGLSVVALSVAIVSLATANERLWRHAVRTSTTPYVRAHEACLLALRCIATDGDRLHVTDSPGFRLGPYLDARVSVVP